MSEQSVEERLEAHFSPDDVSESESQEQPETEVEEQPQEAAESGTEEQAPVEFEEVEYEGRKYQVPPELKDALMAKSDYTAKTTETARLRDTLTLQQKEVALFQEQRAFEQSVAEDVDNLKMLDSYIKHSKENTEWAKLSTDEVVRARLEVEQLEDRRNDLVRALQGKHQEFTQKLAGERKKLKESAAEALQKAIPNYSDEVRGEIEKFALERGYAEGQVQNMSALDYQIAWEASQYRKLQQGKAAAVKTAATAPPVIKPGSSNPMPKDVRDKLQLKKDLAKAKKDNLPEAQRARLIQKELERRLGG